MSPCETSYQEVKEQHHHIYCTCTKVRFQALTASMMTYGMLHHVVSQNLADVAEVFTATIITAHCRETSVKFYQAIRCNMSENRHVHSCMKIGDLPRISADVYSLIRKKNSQLANGVRVFLTLKSCFGDFNRKLNFMLTVTSELVFGSANANFLMFDTLRFT